MTWQRDLPKMNKLLRIKELLNQLADLEIQRVQKTAERMQQTITLTRGK